MSTPRTQELVIPLRAVHVVDALSEARTDQDQFRRQEHDWIEEHNPLLVIDLHKSFEIALNSPGGGPINAGAMLAGLMLGHKSIRLATDGDMELYRQGSVNFNRNRTKIHLNAGTIYATRPVLKRTFSDEPLIDTLMTISHDYARDSAAFIISHFILVDVPVIVPGAGASS